VRHHASGSAPWDSRWSLGLTQSLSQGPHGNGNYKHGRYTAETIVSRSWLKQFTRDGISRPRARAALRLIPAELPVSFPTKFLLVLAGDIA
jgi:hypothetical protein